MLIGFGLIRVYINKFKVKTVIDHARYRFATVIDLPHHIVYTTCHYR